MSLFKMLAEVLTTLENPSNQVINRVPQQTLPADRLKVLVAQGKHMEAVKLLTATMNWSNTRSEIFVTDMEKSNTKGKVGTRNPGKNDTSTKIDRILREQQVAESMAGGSFFDYIKARLKIF